MKNLRSRSATDGNGALPSGAGPGSPRRKRQLSRYTLLGMRVLLAVLVFLAIAEAGCRTPTKDPNDTQRVEHTSAYSIT
jgi:hypothetical protein